MRIKYKFIWPDTVHTDDLARKIDYWIENPEMKAIMSTKYAMQGNTYRVSESVKQAELMFNDAINDFKENGGYGR